MSRAKKSRKRERTKGNSAEADRFFPIGFAGECGNTAFTVTQVENYQ